MTYGGLLCKGSDLALSCSINASLTLLPVARIVSRLLRHFLISFQCQREAITGSRCFRIVYTAKEKASGFRKDSGRDETGNAGGNEEEEETSGKSGMRTRSSSNSGNRADRDGKISDPGGKNDSACRIGLSLMLGRRRRVDLGEDVEVSMSPPLNKRFCAMQGHCYSMSVRV
jgi:hypothetical protein